MTYSITAAGQVIRDADGATLPLPLDPNNSDCAAYLAWVAEGNTATPVATTAADQITKITAACQAAIYAGFTSAALGAPYHYPALAQDQANLSFSVLMSTLPKAATNPSWVAPFWCADADGNWAYLPHTAAQIQQVGTDAYEAVIAALVRNQQLVQQILNASSDTAATAINW